ncbi:MAG: hypothetical protein IPJ76_19045 [Flavobacteriales bacterium]|nr:MAG: hypothetical protein IPJ76_19045 [Flavobacteriales bacterium]
MLCILWFFRRQDATIINTLFGLAAITYGPLLGLFAFGLFGKRASLRGGTGAGHHHRLGGHHVRAAHVLRRSFGGYKMGFETLLVNGALTYIGMAAISTRRIVQPGK